MIEPIAILTYLLTHSIKKTDSQKEFKIASPSFNNHGTIPKLYTCWGEGIMPPLKWSHIPKNTKSFALLIIDEDVPRSKWYQWGAFNIPAYQDYFPSNIHPKQPIAIVYNSYGQQAYHSPCPRKRTHHFKIELYALDTYLTKTAAQNPIILQEQMKHHIQGIAELYGQVKKNPS